MSYTETSYILSNGVLGLFQSIFNICMVFLVLDIWKSYCAPFINVIYLLDGAAAIFTVAEIISLYSEETSTSMIPERPVYGPNLYILVGLMILLLITALIHIVIFIINVRMERNQSRLVIEVHSTSNIVAHDSYEENTIESTQSTINRDKVLTIYQTESARSTWKAFALGASIILTNTALYSDLFLFIPIYSINLASSQGEVIPSNYTFTPFYSPASFLFSRILAIALSTRISSKKLLMAYSILMTSSLPMIFFLPRLSVYCIFAGAFFFGLGAAGIEPCVILMLEQKSHMKTYELGSLIFSSHFGMLFLPFVTSFNFLRDNLFYHVALGTFCSMFRMGFGLILLRKLT